MPHVKRMRIIAKGRNGELEDSPFLFFFAKIIRHLDK